MEVKEPTAKYLGRPHFKQTEVGVIPEEWEVKSLREFGKFEKGIGLLKEDIKATGSTPAIPYTALYTDFSEILNYNHIRWFVDDTSRTYIVSEPCVLIASSSNMAANTGKASALTETKPVAVGREVIIFKTASNCRYISYQLSTSPYRRRTLSLARGTTIKHLYPATFLNYKIALPPFPEQRAIAETLSDADALIESLEQLLTKKRQINQGAMQELLTGKRRLLGFSGEWEETILGEVADVIKGRGLSRAKVTASATQPCILYGELFTVYGRTITNVVSRTDSDEGLASVSDDILMPGSTTTTGIDLATASALLVDGVALGGDINVIRRKAQDYEATFLANYLTHAKRIAIAEIAQGITIHHLYGRDLRCLALQLPSLSEQTAIAAVLCDMDEDVVVLEAKLNKARQLKQGMMQELLTGRIRLV